MIVNIKEKLKYFLCDTPHGCCFLRVAASALIWIIVSCKQIQNQVQAARGTKIKWEMGTHTEINAIFVKCLYGDTGKDHCKHMPRKVSKGVWGCYTSNG